MSEDSLDFITEIRIAQFWRRQLGELEYVKRDPDDLRRWYDALETRGPEDIRDYLNERAGRYPDGQVTGIVAKAPHPPREVIDLWLASYDKTSTMPYWTAFAAFLLTCALIGPYISGCQNLHPLTPFPNGAPPEAIVQPGSPTQMPPSQSSPPGSFPVPANTASPTAGSQSQPALAQ
jgi:hypothetical protein